MHTRILPLILVIFTLGACATADEAKKADQQVQVGEREDMTTGPLSDTDMEQSRLGGTQAGREGVAQEGLLSDDTVMQGTQEDLVVNVGDRVFFGYDQHHLTEEARRTLEEQAAWLKRNPNLEVTVEGHADERGTREYNLALGDRRATSVRNYLVALGVEPGRITTISYGKEKPEVLGSNPTAWAQNRRAVTVVE